MTKPLPRESDSRGSGLPGSGRLIPGQQRSQRPEVQVQVLGPQAVAVAQFGHAVVEEHQGQSDPLLLLLAQVALVDAAQRLALHELAQQLDDGQHQLDQVALDGVGLQVETLAGSVTSISLRTATGHCG